MESILFVLYGILVVVTPLIMYPYTSELFEFNKIIIIYLLAASVFFMWGIDCFRNKKVVLPASIGYIPFALFFLSQVISTITSIDIHTSLFGYYGRFNGGLFSVIAYGVLWIGATIYLNKKAVQRLLIISVITSVLVMAWGIPGHFGHDTSCLVFTGQWSNSCWTDQFRPAERMFSTLGQPNWLGTYLAINVFFGLYFFLVNVWKKRTGKILLWSLYLFLAISCILFTRSRSTLAALGICFVFMAPVFLYYRKQLLHLLIVLPIICFLSAIILWKTGVPIIDNKIPSFAKQTVTTQIRPPAQTTNIVAAPPVGSDITDSLDIRKVVWKGALELGNRYPLFGTGVETFAYSYYFTRPIEHNLTSEWDFLYNKAHNEYLNFFATTGYVGLISYLIFIAGTIFVMGRAIFLSLRRETGEVQFEHTVFYYCLALAYGVILITNYVGFSTTVTSIFFFLIPAFVMIDSSQTKVITLHSLRVVWSMSAIAIVTAMIVIVRMGMYWYADTVYAQAESYTKVSQTQYAIRLYEQALSLHKDHVYEDKLSFALANIAVLFASEKQQKEANTIMEMANYYNEDSLRQSPKNVLYWKTKSKNLYFAYQIDNANSHLYDAVEALKKASELSPTDPKIPYTQALFTAVIYEGEHEAAKKNELADQSIRYINRSIQLKSDFRDAYLLKGQLLKKYGNTEEARKILEQAEQLFGPASDITQELNQK